MRENTTGTPAFDLRECLSNEIERMKRLPIEPEWVRPGLACLTGPNASAWMLCPEKLSSLTGPDGAPVVGVPFTNEIYVAGERNTGAIKHLAQTLVAFANTNTDVESTRLVRFDGSDWIEWKPAEARLRKTCKELEVADLKIQANRQAGLQQVYGDVIPASVHAATVKTIATIKGEFATMAVWAPEPVALPRVDAVAFLRDNGVIVVRWKDVKRRFGDMLVPLGTYPQRFLTTGYPTRKQLDSLASHVRKSESPPNFG